MLYLSRKIGESIIINDNIEVTVIDVSGKTVKLGFSYPATATVLRKEIHERIKSENMQAQLSNTGENKKDIEDLQKAFKTLTLKRKTPDNKTE